MKEEKTDDCYDSRKLLWRYTFSQTVIGWLLMPGQENYIKSRKEYKRDKQNEKAKR